VRLAQIEDLVRYESDGRRPNLEALLNQLTAASPPFPTRSPKAT